MKILLTGGGSGGHFYPLIAVAEELNRITAQEKLVKPELHFLSDSSYDEKMLFDNDISFTKVSAGKLRRYFSIKNIFDSFKTLWGAIKAVFAVFFIYPDVIFSKGGYASFPAVLASRILRIPLVIHESDTVPGRANQWAGKFAKRIAVSYPEASEFFPKDRVAWTGQPIRNEIKETAQGAHRLLAFDKNIPTILILGGSQGAAPINDAVLDILSELVKEFQVIHQTGANNLQTVTGMSRVILEESPSAMRYRPFDYLKGESLKMAAGAADIVVSRAGSAIFEIAFWGKPSVIIPISDSNGDHQRKNAIAYAKSGACLVIEEANLKPHILLSELRRLASDSSLKTRMSESARAFAKPDAAEKIARAILSLALRHEI